MPANEIALRPYEGFSEGTILGTYYIAGPDGLVRTTNIDHAETMTRMHGFTMVGAEPVKPDPGTLGLIHTDELGRTALIDALTLRSVVVTADMGRGELESLANHWNASLRESIGRPHSPAVMEPVVHTSFAPAMQAGTTPQNGSPVLDTANRMPHDGGPIPTVPDFAGMHHKTLAKWLKDRGVAAEALDTKAMITVAQSHYAAHGEAIPTGEVL